MADELLSYMARQGTTVGRGPEVDTKSALESRVSMSSSSRQGRRFAIEAECESRDEPLKTSNVWRRVRIVSRLNRNRTSLAKNKARRKGSAWELIPIQMSPKEQACRRLLSARTG